MPILDLKLKKERSLIGKTPVSKTGIEGSIPSAPAIQLKQTGMFMDSTGRVK